MKKRTLMMLAAGCLAAVTLLSSCGSCTITKPDDGSNTVASDDGNSSNDEHPVIDFSKEDIAKEFNFPKEKIYVTHLAAEEIYLRQATANELKNERLARAQCTDQSEF